MKRLNLFIVSFVAAAVISFALGILVLRPRTAAARNVPELAEQAVLGQSFVPNGNLVSPRAGLALTAYPEDGGLATQYTVTTDGNNNLTHQCSSSAGASCVEKSPAMTNVAYAAGPVVQFSNLIGTAPAQGANPMDCEVVQVSVAQGTTPANDAGFKHTFAAPPSLVACAIVGTDGGGACTFGTPCNVATTGFTCPFSANVNQVANLMFCGE